MQAEFHDFQYYAALRNQAHRERQIRHTAERMSSIPFWLASVSAVIVGATLLAGVWQILSWIFN